MAQAVRLPLPRGGWTQTTRERIAFLAFVLPNVVLLAIFSYWPLVQSVGLSFFEWDMIAPEKRFIGLENWTDILSSRAFWEIARQTLIFTLGSVGFTLVLGLLFALLLNQPLVGRKGARSVLFLPTVLSGSAVSVVWYFIFDPNWGLFKNLLDFIGVASPRWLLDGGWAMASLIIVYTWKNVGYCTVVYLAGLQAISGELYEAARVDGAGAWDRFWAVTLPGLAPISFFLLITSVLLSFQAFDVISVLTKGGPVSATTTILYEYYNQAFVGFRAGPAAVYGVVLFAVMLAITIVQLRFVERRITYS